MPPNPTAPPAQRPAPAPHVSITEIADVYKVAAELTTAHMSSIAGQVPTGVYDLNFGQAVANHMLYVRGVFLTYLAMAEGLIKDPTTPQPTLPPLPAPPAPTPGQPAPAPTPATVASNLGAIIGALGGAAPAAPAATATATTP